MTNRDIEFLFEIGSLKNVDRGWRQHLGMDCANDQEHTFRVVFIALLLGRMEGGADESKIMKMALVHDLAETRTGDQSYVQKRYIQADEDKASNDLFAGTLFSDVLADDLKEYEHRLTKEAKIVKDADNLDVDFELKELAERGSMFPQKVQSMRKMVRDEKLYTDSAKQIWDSLQDSDPSAWHLAANKWKHMPGAGK